MTKENFFQNSQIYNKHNKRKQGYIPLETRTQHIWQGAVWSCASRPQDARLYPTGNQWALISQESKSDWLART